jgi:hypothetical protein
MNNEYAIGSSKVTDFEVLMLIIERNASECKAHQITELLAKIGESKGLAEPPPSTENENCQFHSQSEIAKLPWKSHRTKEVADSTEPAWIFSKITGAEALLVTLKTKDGKASIGNFEYQLQGTDRQFIARKPIK